jgi:hypothetical protein
MMAPMPSLMSAPHHPDVSSPSPDPPERRLIQGEVQAAAARAHWAAKCATTEAAASEQLLQSRRIEIEEIRVARKKRAVAGSIPKGEGEEWKKGFDRQIASRERQQYLKAFQGYQRCRSKKQKVRVEVHPEVQEVRPEVQAAVSNFVQLGKVQEIEEVENLLAIERAGTCLEGASFDQLGAPMRRNEIV